MEILKPTARKTAAANQNPTEREYWLEELSGLINKSAFAADFTIPLAGAGASEKRETAAFTWAGTIFDNLMKLGGDVDQKVHLILTAGVTALLGRLTDSGDIIVGTPIYKQEGSGSLLNTLLAVRNRLFGDMTFKELLLKVRKTMVEAIQHQNYPIEVLIRQLELPARENENEFPLFDVIVMLENLQPRDYISPVEPFMSMIFSFKKTGSAMDLEISYRATRYEADTVKRIGNYLTRFMDTALAEPGTKLEVIEILSEEEKKKLLFDFNDTEVDYPVGKTIHRWFEEQAAKTPDNLAVSGKFKNEAGGETTYKELNENANRLARLLKANGVEKESVVGLMMERSIDSVCGLLAILKTGGTYLPIDTGLPGERVRYMLEDSGAQILLSNSHAVDEISFTALRNFDSTPDVQLVMTQHREPIEAFDKLPMADRSLVDLQNYKSKIGMAGVTDAVSMQTTRGCPYECLFCHKVWSKTHTFRSAENIFSEVEYYYKKGVRNFSILDDCFNLNKKNSELFFRMIVEKEMEIRIYFPNGMRGDILTEDYIDLMVQAGTVNVNLSLETASPRLQKLVKKNLDIEKFKHNIRYIAETYPHVILEIATMHGFPTETEEEAQMTLDFIKGIKWLHFPYIHILKIYPDTEMETLALKHGVSKEDILASKDLAYHDLPETLPFPKSFTRKYKSDFMNNYFLDKDRLRAVLPVQMKVLTEDALVMKYNAYLPTEINSLQDILELAGLENEMDALTCESRVENSRAIKKRVPEIFHESHAPAAEGNKDKKKILLLDLSQHFSSHSMLYNVSEQPLGLLFLMTFIRQELGGRVGGRIYKSGNDFDSFNELKALVEAYEPDLIGIRSLTFYREFFHESVSLLRQWGIDVPIIAGGPYATSDYASILKDKNVNLVVLGEGEYTMVELLGKMLENDFALPEEAVLRNIRGLVFAKDVQGVDQSLEVLQVDVMEKTIAAGESSNLEPVGDDTNLAYVMYTSGSTGKPKGVMVEHRQVNNNNWWMQEKFTLDAGAVVVQRTNLTFDPSVWEIFWPLAIGASIKIIDNEDRKDVAYLTRLMAEAGEPGKKATIMYCPSTLVTALAHFLEMKRENPRLHLPWLVIGAEPITMEVVKTFYSYFEGKIVNTYGPTECTINNTYYDLSPDDPRGIVPIGRPVANNQVYVLSRELQLLPVGITGEICIAGNSLARGYINNREKTVTHFVDNPFGPGKLYKTGDMGHYLPDGNVVISGRTDDQVKIRGHRIEPGDIETALAGHPYIREAVVVAKTNAELKEDIKECKICGIYSNYPGIKISDEHTCNICENLALYKKLITEYFKTPDDFELKLREGNKSRDGKYDCVLVYACERVATYALYKLLDMGFKVMTVTYDSGHYSQESLDRIKRITSNIGVDHAILRHEHSNRILKESLKVAKTMCKGCIHTSSSLAGEFAFKHNIKFVIGETLSRGQIVENKLFKFMEMGIHNVNEIEKEVKSLMRSVASLDKSIYDIINIDVVNDGSLYDIVEFLDFYRYFDITNEEMVAYLDVKDSYWKNLENRATYSTDCKICSVGDFNHLKELGYHYTGSAKSWEKRLGQATMKEVKDDLKINMSAKEHSEFLDDLGYKEEIQVDKNRKYLCAYYVGVEDVGSVQLKEFLAGEVPDYMVPSYFVQLENIPLTTSGKIDKRALPAPGLSSLMEDYEPPENDVEEKLQLVWQEVLGVDGIGVNDDLFNMGGDSIKAIQIVSKLQKYNMKLEIKDLFLHPTIRKARSYVEPVDAGSTRIPEQGVISGELPFTPIQAWFFQEDFIDSHHFNQAMMLHGKKGFDEAKLRTVFDAVVKHHDALRMVFKPAPDGTGVVQRNRGMEEPLYHLEVVHLEDETDPGAVIPQKALAIQSGINTAEGPLLKLALFKTGSGDHLLIVVHHLVMDGVSWRILLEDLGIGFLQVDEGTTVSLQDKSDSFKDWAETLFQYAQTDAALGELMFWQKQESKGRELRGLPKDKKIAPADRKMKHSLAVDMLLEADYTEKLLKEVNRTFNTEINDILLTALGMAIKEWCRLDRVEILLEGHGREPILEDVDVTRTVGWFTSQYPVLLEMDKDDVPGLIKSVKETLRKIPNKGIGYGILRYLTAAERKGSYDVQSDPEIGFNYLGQFGAGGKSGTDGPFSFSPFGTGETKSPEMEAKHALDINGVISDGRLGMSFVFDRQEFNRENIEELAGLYKSNLEKLIAFCVSADFTEKTAADFDAPDLDTEDLDNIYDELEIE